MARSLESLDPDGRFDPTSRYHSAMALAYDVLHAETPTSPMAPFVHMFTASLIVLNVAVVMIESVESIRSVMGYQLHVFDLLSVGVFTVEYLLRLWSSPIGHPHISAARARVRYAFTFFGLVDLFAVLPFFLQAFFAGDLRIIRGLRLLRLERLLLLGRYTRGFRLLGRAIRRTKHELYASFAVIAIVLIISATIVYYVEHDTQADKFTSIPESLWWGIITLTSVGYGDIYPVTPLGKLFGGIISLLGVGLAALPSGLIASGFVQEFKEAHETIDPSDGHVECPACGMRFTADAATGNGATPAHEHAPAERAPAWPRSR